jgi:integrase
MAVSRRRHTRRTEPDASAGPGWADEVDRFLIWKRSETSVGDDWLRRLRWELRRVPALAAQVHAAKIPRHAGDVDGDLIQAFRKGLTWERATFALHFAALRQFLTWSGNPLAGRKTVWRLPSGDPTHRRWLSREQFVRLYRASRGKARLLIGLEGLNGLRRVEVLRLRVRDVAVHEGSLRVLGKGKDGGKWRLIALHPEVQRDLTRAIRGCDGEAHLFPFSKSAADALLRKSAVQAGLAREGVRVSHHDLRRTFGRLAQAAGMDLVQLKNLYGHASMEQTVHYIGLDADRMRSGLVKLGRMLEH